MNFLAIVVAGEEVRVSRKVMLLVLLVIMVELLLFIIHDVFILAVEGMSVHLLHLLPLHAVLAIDEREKV